MTEAEKTVESEEMLQRIVEAVEKMAEAYMSVAALQIATMEKALEALKDVDPEPAVSITVKALEDVGG